MKNLQNSFIFLKKNPGGTYRTSILIVINLLIAVIWAIEKFELTDFVVDSNTPLLLIAFFFTFTLWNGSLILDKRKKNAK
ncbi:MAG: hypothetical protein ACI9TK_001566 [Flavobacteriaceae bacterium]|jgi:hypothetical protein